MAVDPRQRRREGSQRAQASRVKREEARKKRRTRNMIAGVGGLLALVAVITSLLVFTGGVSGPGEVVDTQPGLHYTTPEQFAAWQYNTNPPNSGPHLSRCCPYGFLGAPLVVEEVLHSAEHGAAIIWYRPDDPALAAQVRDVVRDLGGRCLVAGTYANMDAAVAATAWGRIQKWDTFNRSELIDFANAYRGRLGAPGEETLCQVQS